jgi:cob(I)alamin adenosyltransferase
MQPKNDTGVNIGHQKINKGLVHIYTGEGKGKSTTSVGLSVRAIGAGFKVMYRQLFKEYTSEVEPMKRIGIDYSNYPTKHPYFKKYTEEEFENEIKICTEFIRAAFEEAREKDFDMLIIDELGPALAAKMILTEDVIEMIKNKPERLELVLTGRGYPQKILDLADYVSEIKMIFHPFEKGIIARKGIEF